MNLCMGKNRRFGTALVLQRVERGCGKYAASIRFVPTLRSRHSYFVPHIYVMYGKARIARRNDMLPGLIALGCRHGLPCCPRSNACQTATPACRHLANGRKSENRTDRRTDGRADRSIVLRPLLYGGRITTGKM